MELGQLGLQPHTSANQSTHHQVFQNSSLGDGHDSLSTSQSRALEPGCGVGNHSCHSTRCDLCGNPARTLASTLATWRQRKVVEPCAGWSEEMAHARRKRIQELETSETDRPAFELYQQDEAWVQEWLRAHPALAAEDDPYFIHSPEYAQRTKLELGPYQEHWNEVIGHPGGWTYINEAHFFLLAAALRKYPGKRILMTFGAGHKYWFLEQLRWMPDIELMDVRDFLPPPPAPQSKEQPVRDAFFNGWDALQVWWAMERGDDLFAWQQLESILQLPKHPQLRNRLAASKGRIENEFTQGPILGAVRGQAVGNDAWQIHAEIRHLHDQAAQAQWLQVLLTADASCLGGFLWSKLQLPIP